MRTVTLFFAPGTTTVRPAQSSFQAGGSVLVFAGVGRALVKGHDDIGPKGLLDLHRELWTKETGSAVDVTVKMDAFFRNAPQLRQGEDLKPSAISQDRTVPAHELVQAATMLDHFQTGS